MTRRIGLVQTRGIGDIVIALPISDHFIEQGFEVVWPIDERFVEIFGRVKPGVDFVGVSPGDTDYFLTEPLRVINERGCERTIILYSFLSTAMVYDPRLAASLKFDEYKYAAAGVPFRKKWDLKILRDREREERLFDSLGVRGEYVCFHGQSSDMQEPLDLPPAMSEGMQIVEMTRRSDDESPFDWLLTMERAAKLVLIDSCFANLAEQLTIPVAKTFILKNPVAFTPVLKNDWKFVSVDAFRAA
ncbi:MAG TPA: hypothetical protein VL501_09235 [Pyrinomonadaceae bacterium]|nr:hypothetical protein [Pyrinomonadaceae bacterium]